MIYSTCCYCSELSFGKDVANVIDCSGGGGSWKGLVVGLQHMKILNMIS